MKRNHRRWLAVALLLGLLLSCCACAREEAPDASEPGSEDSVAALAAVGDIYLSSSMLFDARMPDGSYSFTSLFAGVIPTLCAADVTLGNFEGCFAGTPYGQDNGSYPDDLAAALSDAGFDILQTANSYSLQNGMSGLERTRSVLVGEQIIPLGTYATKAQREDEQVIALEINGIRFAFIAFTKGLNGMSIPNGSEYCVNLLYQDYDSTYSKIDYNAIDAVLDAANRINPDVIVAALHWGSENIAEVSESQEIIADYLFRNDVDVILGSHSHIAGQIEERSVTTNSGETKNVVVAYSLGDFCMAEAGQVNPSLILQLEFTRSSETGKTTISDVAFTPIATADLGEGMDYRYAVLNIDDAIALYESNYYARVNESVYEALRSQREALIGRVAPTEEK